jgi:hypothetical protein
MQGIPLTISLDFLTFERGCPEDMNFVSISFARVPFGFHWVYICLEEAPLRINFHGFHDFYNTNSMGSLRVS